MGAGDGEKPPLVKFVDFCGVNTPTVAHFSSQHEITEHGIRRRHIQAALRSQCQPAPAHQGLSFFICKVNSTPEVLGKNEMQSI